MRNLDLDVDRARATALNRICPYFTMFPLRFPVSVLGGARPGHHVLDPFCGRGTTNYASRLAGLDNVGIDASPVAVAIAAAKVVTTSAEGVVAALERILGSVDEVDVPEGEFWEWAFGPRTLRTICRVRAGLLSSCRSPSRVALRAVLMGALHGPRTASPSHLSNQAPRTFASKPAYSVKFWKDRDFRPEEQDIVAVVSRRAERYFGNEGTVGVGRVLRADSREFAMDRLGRFDWVITSPPYYGLRTYLPDQWLRNWFVGGPPFPEYGAQQQLSHRSPEIFAGDLRRVWCQAARAANPGARLVVRFGGINDRSADPLEVLRSSLSGSGWRTVSVSPAGSAASGRRQADAFWSSGQVARAEYDCVARRE